MKNQTGFTLLEILVATVILALGLLGMAGMQANSLRNNQAAYFRSQATVLAYDILDRMRASRAAAVAGQYDIALGVASSGSGIVLVDLTEWKATLAAELASGDGSVTTIGNLVTVQIHWNEGKPDISETVPACGTETLHRKVFCTSTQL